MLFGPCLLKLAGGGERIVVVLVLNASGDGL